MNRLLCKTLSLVLIVTFFACFIIACESKPKLQKEEAEKIIRNLVKEEPKYFVSGNGFDACKTLDVDKLVSLGYLEKKDGDKQFYVNGYTYVPTAKAKGYINNMSGRSTFDNAWHNVYASVATSKFKSIDEILLDEKNYIAIVKFRIAYEPIEPFYSAICTCNQCEYFSKKEEAQTIKLKKYDKGWRPVE